MNFYSAVLEKWIDGNKTDYDNNQVIIVAETYYEAQEKFQQCLNKLNENSEEEGNYTYKIKKDLHECFGIMIADGFEDSTYHHGISRYSSLD